MAGTSPAMTATQWSIPLETIIKGGAERPDQPDRRRREMNRQDQRVGVDDGSKKLPPRHRRLLRIPIRLGRPVRLAALDLVMHEIAGHHRALALREDVHAAMARRMPRRPRQ